VLRIRQAAARGTIPGIKEVRTITKCGIPEAQDILRALSQLDRAVDK